MVIGVLWPIPQKLNCHFGTKALSRARGVKTSPACRSVRSIRSEWADTMSQGVMRIWKRTRKVTVWHGVAARGGIALSLRDTDTSRSRPHFICGHYSGPRHRGAEGWLGTEARLGRDVNDTQCFVPKFIVGEVVRMHPTCVRGIGVRCGLA